MTYVLLIYRATALHQSPVARGAAANETVRRGAAASETARSDERATLRAHRKLEREASSRGPLHAVARLEESRDARTVRRHGEAHQVVDGPSVETKKWLVGFRLIDCADEAEAVRRPKLICVNDEHVIEVRPVTWRWTP